MGCIGVEGNKFAAKWSDKDKAKIKAMWESGLSCSQVARTFGVTKGVISGLRDRMRAPRAITPERLEQDRLRKQRLRDAKKAAGLARVKDKRVKAEEKQPRKRAATARQPQAPKLAPAVLPVILYVPNPTPLSRASDNQCRFIEGEPIADALICGAVVKFGTSWCPHHHARLFCPANQPRKKRAPVSVYRKFGEAA